MSKMVIAQTAATAMARIHHIRLMRVPLVRAADTESSAGAPRPAMTPAGVSTGMRAPATRRAAGRGVASLSDPVTRFGLSPTPRHGPADDPLRAAARRSGV